MYTFTLSSPVNVKDENWSTYASSIVEFHSLVFKIQVTEIVRVGTELISSLAEKFRIILGTIEKRRPRRCWIKSWIRQQEQLIAST